MDNKRYEDRTNLSLVLSTLLHGSVIAVVALGPTFIPGLMNGPNTGNGRGAIEVSVASSDANIPAEESLPAPVVAAIPEPAPAPVEPAKVETPVVVAPAPVKEINKKTVEPKKETKASVTAKSESLPEKPSSPEKIEAAPALAIDEDSGVAQAQSEDPSPEPTEMDKLASDDRARSQPEETLAPTETVATEETATPPAPIAKENDPQPEAIENPPVAKVANPTQVAQTENEVSTVDAEKNARATTAAATSASHGGGSAGTQKTIEVTQNYLQLKQLPGNKAPSYSEEMRLKKLQGNGQLVYYVTKSGQVGEIHLVKSTGSAQLDQAALNAFKKYKFVPGQEGYTIHDFEFVLTGPAEANRTRLRTSN